MPRAKRPGERMAAWFINSAPHSESVEALRAEWTQIPFLENFQDKSQIKRSFLVDIRFLTGPDIFVPRFGGPARGGPQSVSRWAPHTRICLCYRAIFRLCHDPKSQIQIPTLNALSKEIQRLPALLRVFVAHWWLSDPNPHHTLSQTPPTPNKANQTLSQPSTNPKQTQP